MRLKTSSGRINSYIIDTFYKQEFQKPIQPTDPQGDPMFKNLRTKIAGATFAVFLPLIAAAQTPPVCVMLATGGTIAMKNDPVKGPVPAISGEDLVATVPGIGKIASMEVHNISNVPSDYMDEGRWQSLQQATMEALRRPEVAGVVVSHGTDTLEETAWFLDLTVNSPKPIILIGAQRNASDFDFDGPRNLLNAARLCVSSEAREKGAMLVMNGQINAAREVMKTHTSDVETFKSGDFGFLGNVDEDRIVFYRSPTRRQSITLNAGKLPYIEIVAMYGGATGNMVRAAADAGAKGLVIQGLGWGNVNMPMYAAIVDVIKKGIPVVISTRVPNGRVLPHYGFTGGGKTLQDAGAIMADNLSPQKARILLMLALQADKTPAEIKTMFDR